MAQISIWFCFAWPQRESKSGHLNPIKWHYFVHFVNCQLFKIFVCFLIQDSKICTVLYIWLLRWQKLPAGLLRVQRRPPCKQCFQFGTSEYFCPDSNHTCDKERELNSKANKKWLSSKKCGISLSIIFQFVQGIPAKMNYLKDCCLFIRQVCNLESI